MILNLFNRLWIRLRPVYSHYLIRRIFIGVLVLIALLIGPNVIQQILLRGTLSKYNLVEDSISVSAHKAKLQAEIVKLDKKLQAKIPANYYLVINTAENEFQLYKKTELIKQDKCSTGSYTLLKNGDQQQWLFKTPKGEFRIQGKTTSPVWKKPDWAFVEAGLPVPAANAVSRFEYGVLGDYALSLGQGYLIHGTLYQRFLGLPVTHGCVRLNDENLELVYKSLTTGSKVYIY
ncbi:L,D-transpeptidase [Marinoscillum pacificum]|uniref:L,D-transpeptidase n=1 Tax=Marinoscillum pacificum TaxID=392723 RepID=UPI0021582311|nr:L,D-transpeptidase [Marinoscillum pacificum]